MKIFQSLVLTMAGNALALPNTRPSPQEAAAIAASYGPAPHSANGAAVSNPNKGLTASVSQYCIDFSSDNPDWHYTLQAPWGSGSGSFGSLPGGRLCVPTNDNAGGAMFIGPDPNPGPGSTKMECFFPSSGVANCDMSLVDGYSLSVACGVSDRTTPIIGGIADLWSLGNCPDQQGPNCKNDNGYASNQSDVDAFFQPAVQASTANNYCIWVNCSQDFYFPVTENMACYVTGTAK